MILDVERTYSEMQIQHICVCWFRMTFPSAAMLLIVIPNGGVRSMKDGYMRKYEGVMAGVSDMILLYPSGGKASLCIEMKRPKSKARSKGVQEGSQIDFQSVIETHGSVYAVCHGISEFIRAVCTYLRIDSEKYMAEMLKKYPTYR